jgi:hypothetical protein
MAGQCYKHKCNTDCHFCTCGSQLLPFFFKKKLNASALSVNKCAEMSFHVYRYQNTGKCYVILLKCHKIMQFVFFFSGHIGLVSK